MTSNSAAGAGYSPRQKRARVLIACQRCKYRKQKCDGLAPSCSSCRKAGTRCVWDRAAAGHTGELGYPAEYVSQLEDRVASLEELLRSHAPEIAEDHLRRDNSPKEVRDEGDYHDELSKGVGLLSLNAAAEPYYLGSTSGFSLARMVYGVMSSSFATIPRETLDLSSEIPASLSSQWVDEPTIVDFPPRHISDQLVRMFFDRIHARYPVMDRVAFFDTYSRRHVLDPNRPPDRMKLFVQHMVYAIGARNFQLVLNPKDGVDPEAHYMAALHYLDTPLQVHGIENAQALLLLSIFSLRASGSLGALGSWHVLGLAMRMAIELGLHRKAKYGNKQLDAYRSEVRKRVFWSGYLLDRTLCITLGRPFVIAEHEIDVEFPVDVQDDVMDAAIIRARGDSQTYAATNLSSFIHMCKLARIESRIQRHVYAVDSDWDNNPNVFEKYLSELDEWRNAAPFPDRIQASPEPDRQLYESREFFDLFYSKAVRILFQPLVSSGSTNEHYLSICARVSGDINQYYKRLHQHIFIGYSVLSLHSVFTAGITLLYCVWMRRNLIQETYTNDIRACSSVLFAIAERLPIAKKYRDTFDALASAMLDMIASEKQQTQMPPMESQHLDLFPTMSNIENLNDQTLLWNDGQFEGIVRDFLDNPFV